MSGAASRVASKVGAAASKVGSAAGEAAKAGNEQTSVLQKGAKRDPELYVLFGIMSGVFGLAGWHFGRKPTSASSESAVSMAENSMPWHKEGAKSGAYQYHPGGDKDAAPKEAPSALHSVIVPNVNLPKSLHEKYNKWGKDDY